METTPTNTLSRFRGAILGAAVADALALPYQHYSRSFLRALAVPLTEELGLHHSGFYPRGQYSNDTQEMMAVVASILDSDGVRGDSIASHLVPLWRDNLLVERDESSAEPMARLVSGEESWESSGLEPGHAEVGPSSRVIGIALWHHRDLDALCDAVSDSTRITHRDPRAIAGAVAIATAIATNAASEELILGAFLDGVSSAAGRFDPVLAEAVLDFPRFLSMSENRALRHIEALCPDDRYASSEDGLGTYAIPAVLTAIYYFLRAPYRYEKVVDSCLRVGGIIDTPAFLAGAMSGALVGETGIPSRLAEQVVHAVDLARGADELHAAWERKESP